MKEKSMREETHLLRTIHIKNTSVRTKCALNITNLTHEEGKKMRMSIIVLMVLSIAAVANAGLTIVGVPTAPIMPSTTVTLSIVSDGLALDPLVKSDGIHILIDGPGYLDISGTTAPGATDGGVPLSDRIVDFYNISGAPAPGIDIFVDLAWLDIISDPPGMAVIPAGVAVDGLVFHCESNGPVTITIVTDYLRTQLDQVVITQIPEPMTIGLLALGGLFLRRRK
jgi:hypothetical protein